MGFRSKILFFLIVYFAGFATAIYYLAPPGEQGYSSGSYSYSSTEQAQSSGGVLDKLCDKAFSKASAGFSGMDSAEFKEKFNLGMQKLMEMAKNSGSGADDK